jgi:outer membrane protein TolC
MERYRRTTPPTILATCLFITAMAAALSGCAVVPPKPLSPLRMIESFEARTLTDPDLKAFMERNLHQSATPWPPTAWNFSMLTLAAFYYHPDLDVARAQWKAAEAGRITAGERPNPDGGLSPQYHTGAAIGVSPWTLGFSLDIPIETAGKRGYRIAQARSQSEAARLNTAVAAWQVRSRLRTALLRLYSAERTEALLHRQDTLQKETANVVEQRFSAGEASRPERTQAEIGLEQTRLALGEAQRESAQARVQLADAMGLSVRALEGVVFSFDDFDRLPSDLPSEEVRRKALQSRPDISAALAEYEASEAALQSEIAKQYPDLRLGPGYSWDQGANVWSLGLAFALPIFQHNQGPIAEAESRRGEAEARFTALQARVVGEIDGALAGARAALQGVEGAETLSKMRQRTLRSAQAMFDGGETDRLSLLNAQVDFQSAVLNRLDTRVKAQQALGLLEDAVWRPIADQEILADPRESPRTQETRP